MNLKTTFQGRKAEIIIAGVEINHSSAFQFALSKFAKENFIAEIERLDKDIELAQALVLITKHIDEIFAIIRGSENPELAKEKIAKQFTIKAEHIRVYMDMGVSDIISIDFSTISTILLAQRKQYQSILEEYYARD
ncbi:MAG: hypothetical protein MH472_05535 [Bacteroidia bacterium]|nr:hypothetical protein [Bacteroidia bacterium]